ASSTRIRSRGLRSREEPLKAPAPRAHRIVDGNPRARTPVARRSLRTPDLPLAFAHADAADAISLAHFRTGLAVERKPDLTPVTEADRAVESELRRLLARGSAGDAVLGEEDGASG